METSSCNVLKLTGLPLATLARIISVIVGDSVGTEGIFNGRSWRLIQPIRATSRLLREATSIMIRGLYLNYIDDNGLRIKSGEDPLPGHSVFIPLDVVLSLPRMHELKVIGRPLPNGFARALEEIPGLKRIELRNTSENSVIRFRAFKSASTVEQLGICGFGEESLRDLLSFQYGRLSDLNIGDFNHAPVIPERVLTSVKSVTLSSPKPNVRDENLSMFYKSLTKGQNLRVLRIGNCTFKGMDSLHTEDRFAALTELSIYIVREYAFRIVYYSKDLTSALAKGRFPSLQELTLNIHAISLWGATSILAKFEAALAALGHTLRKITISTDLFLTEQDISMFRRMQSCRAFELHITIFGGREIISLQLFRGLSCLTSIGFCDCKLKDVDELVSLPNLKEVSFISCSFSRNDIPKLKNLRGSIGKVKFVDPSVFVGEGES